MSTQPEKADLTTVEDIESLKEPENEQCGDEPQKDLLLLGLFQVNPDKVVNVFTVGYILFFIFHRIADMTNLFTLDCRFPKGLDYLYSSEEERLQCVAYQEATHRIVLPWSILTFVIVMAILYTKFYVTLDAWVYNFSEFMGAYFCCSGVWCLCAPFYSLIGCACSPCRWLGIEPEWKVLFRGAVFLTLVSAFFQAVDAPFKVWLYNVDAQFGFANVVSMPPGEYQTATLMAPISTLMGVGIPSLMLYLWILNWKYGWVIMWATICVLMTVAQYYLYQLVPMVLGPTNIFPSGDFAVGRNFPLVTATDPDATDRVVSLNRIFYPTNESGTYMTHDLSRGAVELNSEASKTGQSAPWEIKAMEENGTEFLPFAETKSKITFHDNSEDLEALQNNEWAISNSNGSTATARMGFRKGKDLRDTLFAFAEERGVHINEVYLVDSSSKDARANAFAAGAGGGRIIALYDTLFLGDDGVMTVQGGPEKKSVENMFSIRYWGKVLQGLPTTKSKPTWFKKRAHTKSHSKDPGGGTTAMSDIEVLAVMGHELGHSALHHVEWGAVQEAVTSFFTFALLGWAVHSPVLAAGVGLHIPVVHVGVFLYNRLLNNVLSGFLDPVENAMTRSHEYAADAYSARVSLEYAEGLQTALSKLTVSCNQDPNEPWYQELLHDDHPTLAHRWQQVAAIKRNLYPEAKVHEE